MNKLRIATWIVIVLTCIGIFTAPTMLGSIGFTLLGLIALWLGDA